MMARMTSVRRNLVANLGGIGAAAALQVVFVPIYVHLMGIEAFGLVGFFMLMQAVVRIADLGLSTTVRREVSRRWAGPDRDDMADLVFTVEVGTWAVGLLLGLGIFFGATEIASRWIETASVARSTLVAAVAMMGAGVAAYWPINYYVAVMLGSPLQVRANAFRLVQSTVTHVGAVVVLLVVSRSILAYLAWQIAAGLLFSVVGRIMLWTSVNAGRRPKVRPLLLRQVWGFAAGMSGISIVGLILSQLDKIVVSHAVGLKLFGYYSLCAVVGGGLLIIITPIFDTFFPRLSASVAAKNDDLVSNEFDLGSQVMSALLLPVGLAIAIFPKEVLWVWTGDPEAARIGGVVVSFLVLGTVLNGLMNLPYALQLAMGTARLAFGLACLTLIVYFPLLVVGVTRAGIEGVAIAWLAANLTYVIVGIPLTHRVAAALDPVRWIVRDLGPALLACGVVVVAFRAVIPDGIPRLETGLALVGVVITGMTAAVLASSRLRPVVVAAAARQFHLVISRKRSRDGGRR